MSARRRCPICSTELEAGQAPGGADAPRSPWPFCSNRCRVIDLGRWLGEDYRLPERPGVVDPQGFGGFADGDDELLH